MKGLEKFMLALFFSSVIGLATYVVPVVADEIRPGVFRTPDDRFENLPGYPFAPNYVEIGGLRMHYVDEGDTNSNPVLMLHGEPTWSYLYRKMIPPVAEAGHRVIAPDLIGFGRSDKPASTEVHTYAYHVAAITEFIEELDLQNIVLVCQDWGSLIGLRVAAESPERFVGIVLANGALPTGESLSPAFDNWRQMVVRFNERGDMPIGGNIARNHGAEIGAAYNAPFPDARYKAGPLTLPLIVPVTPDDPAVVANLAAWEVFKSWGKPFLTAFSDGDPVTAGQDARFREEVPGAQGQNHTTIIGAGHFLQEDKGEELAEVVIQFIEDNQIP